LNLKCFCISELHKCKNLLITNNLQIAKYLTSLYKPFFLLNQKNTFTNPIITGTSTNETPRRKRTGYQDLISVFYFAASGREFTQRDKKSKDGKVHQNFIFVKIVEPIAVFVIFRLSKYSFGYYRLPTSV